jgi:hypothetical protein
MPRKLHTLAAAASALLWVVNFAFWLDGWSLKWHRVEYRDADKLSVVLIAAHRSYIVRVYRDPNWRWSGDPARVRYDRIIDDGDFQFAGAWGDARRHGIYHFGFGVWRHEAILPSAGSVMIPQSFFLMALAIPPLVWLRHCWQQMRCGLCRACGYDLRATPDRCPECGAVTASEK